MKKLSTVLSGICVFSFVLLEELDDPADAAPLAPIKAEAPSDLTLAKQMSNKGIGVTLGQAKYFFSGFIFEKDVDLDGQERVLAENAEKREVAQLIGPPNDLSRIVLTFSPLQGDPQGTQNALDDMTQLLQMAAPRWNDAEEWLKNAVRDNGASINRGRLAIKYEASPSGNALRISIAAR